MPFETFYMQIFCAGLLILAAHYGGRISRRLRVGEVVGQVVGGLLVGPVLLLAIGHQFPAYAEAIESLHFFTFVFLSLIAFGLGDELHLDKLRQIGHEVFTLSVIQAVVTWVCVSGAFLLLGFKPIVALIIGSIGVATAPAATFAIMNKLDITGRMRNMLGGMVVIDDVLEIIVFSITCQVALLLGRDVPLSWDGLALPVLKEFGFALLIGLIVFSLLRLAVERRWLHPKETGPRTASIPGPEFLSRLISEMPGPSVQVFLVVAGCVCLGVGAALHFHLPFLVTAVSAGFLISNFYSREVFRSLRIGSATSIFTLVFFALIGASADLHAFHMENLFAIGVYVVARSVGKIGGTWLGCRITKQEPRLCQSLPKLMLPQAGVAAVEAFYVAAVLGQDGETVLGIILPGLIVFEIVGVLASERTLLRWRSWTTGGGELLDEEEVVRQRIEKQQIDIGQLLHLDCLRIPLEVRSKGEAIWELIRTLQSAGHLENPGEILQIILQRERQGGTTLGDGIAILHGRIPNMDQPMVALGILPPRQTVLCGGPEDDPVDIIYLVLSPVDPPEVHLAVLASIARLLGDRDARTRLRYAKNENEALQIIREHTEHHAPS